MNAENFSSKSVSEKSWSWSDVMMTKWPFWHLMKKMILANSKGSSVGCQVMEKCSISTDCLDDDDRTKVCQESQPNMVWSFWTVIFSHIYNWWSGQQVWILCIETLRNIMTFLIHGQVTHLHVREPTSQLWIMDIQLAMHCFTTQ